MTEVTDTQKKKFNDAVKMDQAVQPRQRVAAQAMTDAMDQEKIAERLGLPFQAEIEDSQVDTALLTRLPLAFVRNNLLLPLKEENGRLLVAVGNPADLLAIDELPGIYGMPVDCVAVPPVTVLDAVNRLYARLSGSAQEVVEELEGEDLSTIATELSVPQDLLELTDEAPVIRLLNSIIFQAVKERASDIHIEPFERELEVRFRIDGILYKMLAPPKVVQEALISRVKIMAGLNIAEKRLPQDGRIRVIVAGRDVDIRVSIIPTFFGERVVLRLLDKQKGVISLADIGFAPADVQTMERLLSRTSGIILVTGPTGSGKTTTLYAAISRINSPEKNIITIEDPIEYQLKGVGQIQVNPKIDLTFANGLRSMLRQDPDIIMVGEIRDCRNRGDRHAGVPYRPPGPFHPPYQRCGHRGDPPDRHGGRAVHGGLDPLRGACPAARQGHLSPLPGRVQAGARVSPASPCRRSSTGGGGATSASTWGASAGPESTSCC